MSEGTGAAELERGATFGRYVITRRLGGGGMAAVYEARHVELHKRVALKVLLASLAIDPQWRERFLREARAAARLSHPHAIDVVDVGVHQGAPYIVMEHLEGEDLRATLDREGPMEPERAVGILLPIAAALRAAHRAGIVHRDVKPENIFVARTAAGGERPVLLDFGIAKQLGAETTAASTHHDHMLGTPWYMAPEQAACDPGLDARADQYALGVVLYECLTGERPFRDERSVWVLVAAILAGRFEPPRSLRPELHRALESTVLRAMSLLPEDRFASLAEMGRALLPFASPAVRAAVGAEFDAGMEARADDEARAWVLRSELPTRCVALDGRESGVVPAASEGRAPRERSAGSGSGTVRAPQRPWSSAASATRVPRARTRSRMHRMR